MRRRNYVTPTSYLELIKTFKTLLNKKRLELLTLKDRYVVGLEKLEFSESQVIDFLCNYYVVYIRSHIEAWGTACFRSHLVMYRAHESCAKKYVF